MSDDVQAQRAQLQQALNLLRKVLELFGQVLDIMEQITQGQQDPNSEEQG